VYLVHKEVIISIELLISIFRLPGMLLQIYTTNLGNMSYVFIYDENASFKSPN